MVDDVDRLVRNLQAYDSIVEWQRLIIVAEESQQESLGILRDRGCVTWHLAADELLGNGGDGDLFRTLLQQSFKPGTVWKANLNRWDGVEPNRRMSIWSDPVQPRPAPHVPARFGELVFVQ
jgi:hypothetical protein